MNRDEIMNADEKTLNRLAATEVMEWVESCHNFWWKTKSDGLAFLVEEWMPATDYNDAAVLRREIERLGLQDRFTHMLYLVIDARRRIMPSDNVNWLIANASPADITRACLLAKLGA